MSSLRAEQWVEQALGRAPRHLGGPGPSLRAQFVVTGTEEADLGVHLIIDDGRLAGAGLGPLESPDITFTLSRADAEELAYGTGDLNAGYMQGRVKVAGDPAHLLSLLRLAAMPAFKSWLGAVAAALGR